MDDNKYFKDERDKIIKGLEETYRKLIEFKKQKKTPIVVSKNGEIVEINPNEIQPTTSYWRKII
ncbi:hypothetical protein [Fulvivirga imtechensis]|nr:hypothetical protein [Fulvivirga imtechensis]